MMLLILSALMIYLSSPSPPVIRGVPIPPAAVDLNISGNAARYASTSPK